MSDGGDDCDLATLVRVLTGSRDLMMPTATRNLTERQAVFATGQPATPIRLFT